MSLTGMEMALQTFFRPLPPVPGPFNEDIYEEMKPILHAISDAGGPTLVSSTQGETVTTKDFRNRERGDGGENIYLNIQLIF